MPARSRDPAMFSDRNPSMRKVMLPLQLVAFLLPAFVFAQDKKKDKDEPLVPITVVKIDRKEPVTYEKDVEPILANKCHFCHSGAVKESKYDMATYEGLM